MFRSAFKLENVKTGTEILQDIEESQPSLLDPNPEEEQLRRAQYVNAMLRVCTTTQLVTPASWPTSVARHGSLVGS